MRRSGATPAPIWMVLLIMLLVVGWRFPDRRPTGEDPTTPAGSAYCPGCQATVVPDFGKCPLCGKPV